MVIGGKKYSEIVIIGEDNEVLAVISDDEIIEKDGVAVVFNEKYDNPSVGFADTSPCTGEALSLSQHVKC